jgi:hypothetical protein
VVRPVADGRWAVRWEVIDLFYFEIQARWDMVFVY